MDRLKRYFGCGVWAGKLFVIVVVVDYLIYCLLEIMYPRDQIDVCKPWPAIKDESFGSGTENGVVGRYGTAKQKVRRRKSSKEFMLQ
jgi:phosphatidylinositol glycan class A protein